MSGSQKTRFDETDLRTSMDCLSFVTAHFFASQIKCAVPGGTCSRIADTIRFLKRNFEREERTMDIVDYPERLGHKKEHQRLLERLLEMEHTLVCSGYDNLMLFDLIVDWQKKHVSNFDEPFGRYLHEYENKSSGGG